MWLHYVPAFLIIKVQYPLGAHCAESFPILFTLTPYQVRGKLLPSSPIEGEVIWKGRDWMGGQPLEPELGNTSVGKRPKDQG
jgi:hypothetical protein